MELRFVTANGLRFAYHEQGEGPLVLLLHGFPDTPHTWDRVQPALAAAGFRVVAPFMRGYHPSEIPDREAFHIDDLGRDAIGLVDALGADRAIVVGHDWGAAAAYSAANTAPERVRFLVTVGIPHPGGVVPTPRIAWAVRHFLWLRMPGAAARVRRDGFAHIDELVQRWSPAWRVPVGETDAVKRCFAEPGSLEAALGYYRALTPWAPPSLRRKTTVDAVAFAGEHDTISTELYDRVRRRYSGAYEVVRMPGGHFMHREHPEHFIRELLRVLAPYRAA